MLVLLKDKKKKEINMKHTIKEKTHEKENNDDLLEFLLKDFNALTFSDETSIVSEQNNKSEDCTDHLFIPINNNTTHNHKMKLRQKISKNEIQITKKMSEKYYYKLISIYNNIYLQQFKDNINDDIYNILQNIAKKKYYKDEKFAIFQENFFQDFLRESPSYNLYNIKKHQRLLSLREKYKSL